MSFDPSAGTAPPPVNISAPPAHESGVEDWIDWANSMPSLGAVGLTCTAMTGSTVEFVLDPETFPRNINGAINGGLVACAADQAMGVAAVRGSRSHAYAFTVSLTTHFHRPAMPPLVVRARLIPGGKRIAFVDVEMEGTDGARCASAQGALRLSGGGTS
ncbi:MAG TPA: PaaI family thioesterase [Mycobacterium sp.]